MPKAGRRMGSASRWWRKLSTFFEGRKQSRQKGNGVEYKPYLALHVFWHPGFGPNGDHGRAIAEMLYRDLGRDPDRPMAPPIGIPIYFTTAQAGHAPSPLELDRAHHTVAVFLVSPSMVNDEAWQAYAKDIDARARASGGTHVVLPVTRPKEGDLDLATTQAVRLPEDPALQSVMLRIRLAAELCRLMTNVPRGGDPDRRLSAEPPRLFISHAKRDATGEAEVLKKLIEDTPLDVFFDRVDIAAGSDFTQEIKENIKRSAVLAWQSDEYASRPWCNIELITAKEHLRPLVVVLGLKTGEERSFPYLGNVRTIVATADNAWEIVAAAVREYVRKLYTEGRFQTLAAAGLVPKTRLHLYRPPEPIDGALLQDEAMSGKPAAPDEATPPPGAVAAQDASADDRGPDADRRRWVLYPDPPLGTVEAELLDRLFPAIKFVTPVTGDGRSCEGLTVGLSIAESPDLGAYGQSEMHLLSAMVEIARHVLCRRGSIAYGGDLRERNRNGYTRQLFELVRSHADLGRGLLNRILNFVPFHAVADLPAAEEARLRQLATFVKPLPAGLAARYGLHVHAPAPVPDDTAENRFVRARCLTAMRIAMTDAINARVALGGRVSGHQGKYPGILEEVLFALEAQKPVYLVGAFGGCAAVIARAIREGRQPVELTVTYQAAHPRVRADGGAMGTVIPFEELVSQYERHASDADIGDGTIDYDQAAKALIDAGIAGLRNGLTDPENLELFDTADLDRIVYLIVKGLNNVRPGATSTHG